MNLTPQEEAILGGKEGKARQKAMEIIVALGNIYEAPRLIPVSSVQVSGVSYKNLGDAGLEFLNEWAEGGARVSIPTTLNPAGMDLDRWKELGFKEEFAAKQQHVISCYRRFGIPPICSCTPYLIGNVPAFREHIAWAESSAVSFANSVLGARTNREGGPSALASAILGKTACYGLHLDENRMAKYLVEVRCEIKDEADYGALGYLVGKIVGSSVPFFRGLKTTSQSYLKGFGASMAASGAVALYHIEGVTPEAKIAWMVSPDAETISIDTVEEGYKSLDSTERDIDLVTLGCPHCSYEELEQIANTLDGKKIKSRLWVTTAMPIYAMAKRSNIAAAIEKAGGEILSDTCLIVAPTSDFKIGVMATNSAKAACYAPAHCGVKVRYGNLSQCLQSALEGKFPGR